MSGRPDVRAHITSRLDKLKTLDKLAEEMTSPRRGKGWDPSMLTETVVKVIPKPLDKLARKAITPGIYHRIADWFRPPHAASRLAAPPSLVYLPLWHVRGYHECFCLRDAKYKIKLDRDVVAVEVDGETVDLMMEEPESKIVPETFRRQLRRFSRLFTSERRYFHLDAIELAVRHRRAEMYTTSDGREGEVLDEILPRSWKTQRIFELRDLNVEGAIMKTAASSDTKQKVVQRFQEKIVRMPETSRQVLSNTFEIEDLTQYHLPYVHFPITRGARVDHVILNAASAEIPDEKDANSVKRQLGL